MTYTITLFSPIWPILATAGIWSTAWIVDSRDRGLGISKAAGSFICAIFALLGTLSTWLAYLILLLLLG